MSIALVLYRYGLEVSPTIKGICEYCWTKNIRCDIYIDELQREKSFRLPHTDIVEVTPFSLSVSVEETITSIVKRIPYVRRWLVPRIRAFFSSRRDGHFSRTLSTVLGHYDTVFCVEFYSLAMVEQSGIPLEKVMYYSLELEQLMMQYPKEYCVSLLTNCRGCIIQDTNRGADLIKYLGTPLNMGYLPVSRSPLPNTHRKISDRTEIVFSGYFAQWSSVEEIVTAFNAMRDKTNYSLTLHGHAVGTEKYLDLIRTKIAGDDRITINANYLNDDDHIQFLRNNDIGLALYRTDSNLSNWKNLIFSSGKIVNYAWAGLAIITNIDSPLTKEPPFIYVNELNGQTLHQSIAIYEQNKDRYRQSAYTFALTHYNLFTHMEKIWQQYFIQHANNNR